MPDRSEQAEGKVKEVAGKVTGNDRLEAEGQTQKGVEDAKGKVEELGDKAKGVVDGLKNKN